MAILTTALFKRPIKYFHNIFHLPPDIVYSGNLQIFYLISLFRNKFLTDVDISVCYSIGVFGGSRVD